MLRDLGAESHLAGDYLLLVLSRLALSPGLFVPELAIVEDAADRGPYVRSDLNKVGFLLAGEFKGTGNRHDAQFFAVISD
jgi:hypothetical protein